MKTNVNMNDVVNKLKETCEFLADSSINALAEKVLNCKEELEPNVREWLEDKPFSDIWIRDKYCVNAVLKIRGNPTSEMARVYALISLNDYAENANNEHLIWQRRM